MFGVVPYISYHPPRALGQICRAGRSPLQLHVSTTAKTQPWPRSA
jgi:hypothetical protein